MHTVFDDDDPEIDFQNVNTKDAEIEDIESYVLSEPDRLDEPKDGCVGPLEEIIFLVLVKKSLPNLKTRPRQRGHHKLCHHPYWRAQPDTKANRGVGFGTTSEMTKTKLQRSKVKGL